MVKTGSTAAEIVSADVDAGIRGWLLVLVLWLGIGSPIYSIGLNLLLIGRMEEVYPTEAALFRAENWHVWIWAITAAREAMRVIAAMLLYSHRSASSVWIAITVLWVSGPLLILGSWVIAGGEVSVPALVRSAIAAFVWTLFLFLSRRVKATYHFGVGK